MKSYQNYSESDLRLFKAAATKINNFIGSRRQQFDRKQLIVNDRYKKTDILNQQYVNKAKRSISLTRINFIYHQAGSSKSFSIDNYTQTDKLQQKLVQNKKDKFMKVISKNYIPKDVLKFVYGKQSPQSINHPHSIETHPSALNTKIGQQQIHYRASIINRDKIVYDRIGVKNGLMSNGQGFEYFPLGKIKRWRNNSSSRKSSSSSELQLLDNCKNQLVKQQYKTLMQNKNDKCEGRLRETQVQNRSYKQRQPKWIQRQAIDLNKAEEKINVNVNANKNNNDNNINIYYDDKLTQQQHEMNQYHHYQTQQQINHFNNNSYSQRQQDWNNTIKFNHINLHQNHSNINSKTLGSNINSNKLQQTNHSSNFNMNNTDSTFNNTNFNKLSHLNNTNSTGLHTNNNNNESPFTQQNKNIKNHTQKISEFILCDQQIPIQQNPFKTNTNCHQFHPQIKDTLSENNYNTNQNNLNNSPTQNNIDQNKNIIYQNNYLFQQYTLSGLNNKRNIPVFQIKLSDLQKEKDLQLTNDIQTEKEKDLQFQNIQTLNQKNQNPNEQSIKDKQKILHNIQTSDTLAGLRQSQNNHHHSQNFHIYDQLQSSIQQLGKNIRDLSGKISTINEVKNDQTNVSITNSIKDVNKQKKLDLSSNCYSQKVTVINHDDNKKQKHIQINNSFNNNNNNLYQESNKKEIKIIDDDVGQDDEDKDIKGITEQNHDEQVEQHDDSHQIDVMSQNQFLNYSYSRQLKQHLHFESNEQQSQGQPSEIKTINQNNVLGSLEIIDHQTSLMGQSLHNIYANSQSHFINGQKQKHGQNLNMIEEDNILKQQNSNLMPQQQNNRHVHFEEYDEKDQNNFNQQLDNIPQQRQQKSLTQNFFNKLQRQRRIRQFYGVKTFQKTRSKSQMQKYNKNQLHKFNNYNGSNNFQNKTFNNKNFQRQSKLFQSKGLNYQMYKTYRDKSLTKRYTLLGVDHRKQRLIQLPYMDRPFDMKLNGESIKLPKYIKSKVYYVKG